MLELDLNGIPEPQQEVSNDEGKVYTDWADALHQNIIREGIAKVKKDKPSYADRLTTMISYGGINKTAEQILLDDITWPDSYEQDLLPWPFQGHFYDPATGCNYAGYTSPTAYTRIQ